MNHAYRNPVLQRLHAAANGRPLSGLSEVTYQTGQTWTGFAALQPQFWFPESGVLALEQEVQAKHLEVALLGCMNGVPWPEQHGLRLRALTDGRAHLLPAELVMSICPEVFLQCQQALTQQMARWAYCVRHHGLSQGLADRLLWAHQACPQEVLAWSVHDLPGRQSVLPAQMDRAVQALAHAGAVSLQGPVLRLQNPDALQTMACGCHSRTSAPDAVSPVTIASGSVGY